MQRERFMDHLMNDLGYPKGTAENNATYAAKDEGWLMADPAFAGMDLDIIVGNDSRMKAALEIVAAYDTPGSHKYANALRFYYRFVNGRWYDGPIKGGRAAAGKTNVPEKCVRSTVIEWSIPKRLGDREVNDPFIFYAPSVPEEEKVPGLVSYLCGEYDHLTSSRGHFILDRSMYEGRFQDNMFPMIPVILSNGFPMRTYHDSDECIRDRIMARMRQGEEGLEKDILDILKERDFTDHIFGTYSHAGGPDYALCSWHEGQNFMFRHHEGDEEPCIPRDMMDNIERHDFFRFPDGSYPYITIHYRNTVIPDPKEYEALLGNVLAHEYFHFLHDVLAGRRFAGSGAEAGAVKEALADFFGMMYSLYMSYGYGPDSVALRDIAQKRYDGWDRRFGSSWPYANALYMYFTSCGRIDHVDHYEYLRAECGGKFNEVLDRSRASMGKAYRRLTELK